MLLSFKIFLVFFQILGRSLRNSIKCRFLTGSDEKHCPFSSQNGIFEIKDFFSNTSNHDTYLKVFFITSWTISIKISFICRYEKFRKQVSNILEHTECISLQHLVASINSDGENIYTEAEITSALTSMTSDNKIMIHDNTIIRI